MIYGGAGNDITVRMFTLRMQKLRRCKIAPLRNLCISACACACYVPLQSESWRFRRSYIAMLSSEEEDNDPSQQVSV